jgi:starch synthase (maltosyl-transferring)
VALPAQDRSRATIDAVRPEIDAGRFPIKRCVGESVDVEADVFCDGHDKLSVVLRYRHATESDWREMRMHHTGNDRWVGSFSVTRLGRYRYTVHAWIDHFETWRSETEKRVDEADIAVALQIGAAMVQEAAGRAAGADRAGLESWVGRLLGEDGGAGVRDRQALALDESLLSLMQRYDSRAFASEHPRELEVVVDPERAKFSAWYELFPRSWARESGAHGTFADVEAALPYVAGMGFDVLYLPPIHPIGETKRKGPNNTLDAGPDDPGSPWAIGSKDGGHKSIHPALGSDEDFRRLVKSARELGAEVALDIAFQCSPDHPYVKEHPQWFRHRPDGSIQYAENPPKKYQDIYPINFETEDWRALWLELRDVVLHWIGEGVRVFRVDNPHTKSLAFWEWCINEVKEQHPDVIFLSEAFARPKIMYRLAKLGFTQSYTYFTWRNTKWELERYLRELTSVYQVREFFRPNFWPNTPDILPEYLQFGGRSAFMIRHVLAATMTGNYGIYGPAFELCEHEARELGSEEYLNSEKYEIRRRSLDRPESLRDFIARINRIRKENPALHEDWNLRFHEIDNEEIVCYSKTTGDRPDAIVVVVNLDPHHEQSGWVSLPLADFGLEADRPYQVHDLLGGSRFLWNGPRNFVQLSPERPAHIFRIRRRVRSERDFEYFL